MNIIVLVKQVPDTTEVKLDPKTGNLIREGIESIINPDDRHALEAALSLKETYGGRITTISMGPPQAIDAISEALGMGADKGILLSDKAFAGADTWATSYTLGKAVEKAGPYDLILCGRQAIDGDTAQIGPQVADYLGLPQVTYVFEIESVKKKTLSVKRRLEDGFEVVQCALPALLTVIGELNTPRYPRVGNLIDACREKAPIEIWNAADIGVTTAEVGLQGSLTHVIKTFAPKFERKGEMIEGTPKEATDILMDRLKENRLL
ncbi:MAG: electron transfer flavoprotein subunit beta/FixA family protein [Deltaproteobacteria bacterium]|nr:electron transfer flavoprotein subunit beta/FixA family protein [Deltaproteobacteria bacterium]MCF8120315.1 electron transfer flavoprotein subunit beta/FixA family protein [Deltaproteobacteria bacterium]